MKPRTIRTLPMLCFAITAACVAAMPAPGLIEQAIHRPRRGGSGRTRKGTKGAFGRSPLQLKPEPKPPRHSWRYNPSYYQQSYARISHRRW